MARIRIWKNEDKSFSIAAERTRREEAATAVETDIPRSALKERLGNAVRRVRREAPQA